MGISYMDDNSVPVGENGADSRAMNPNTIVNRDSADASENRPMSFSNDPIIEANLRSNAQNQAVLERVRASSEPSGPMNKSTSEMPQTEYDQEQ